MAYTIKERDAIQVVEVQELLNEDINRVILQDVQTKIQSGFNRFVVDLSRLNFMNSVGLNFLINMLKKSNDSGGQLAVIHANEQVLKLLEITKLTPMFDLSPDLDAALQGLQRN